MTERLAEVRNRLPDSNVDEDTASRDTPMQLRRNITGLLLEKGGVTGPRLDQLIRFLLLL